MTKKKLVPLKEFRKRLIKSSLLAISMLFISLLIGVFGYMTFFELSWVDGLYNASMILTGMGPVNSAPDNSAKIFASFYAIYSGIAFLTSVGVLLAPILHRFLHKFHLDVEED